MTGSKPRHNQNNCCSFCKINKLEIQRIRRFIFGRPDQQPKPKEKPIKITFKQRRLQIGGHNRSVNFYDLNLSLMERIPITRGQAELLRPIFSHRNRRS